MSITGMPVGSLGGRPNVVDAFASETHYEANVKPVFDALPEWDCGVMMHGLVTGRPNPVIVASYNDYRACNNRPVIFMEHGTGQTYGDNLASYAGARRRDGVILFLCPNERVADANYATHPDIPVAVVGTPKMDPYWDLKPESDIVGIAWHWDAEVVPEARTALRHYDPALKALAEEFHCIGTAHPRIAAVAASVYADYGIEYVAQPSKLYEEATILVCDNTTLGWEFIAMDRPVVWCNAPWYRRHVNHGLRFWEYVDSGIEIDEPAELSWAVGKALSEPSFKHERRMEVRDILYPYRGDAAQRAAQAIVELVGGKHGRRTASTH